MHKFIKTILFTLMLALTSLEGSYAQEKQKITQEDYVNSDIEMADVMRSNGKIYIVVATIIALFSGFTIYLISIDKKIGKLEEKFTEEQQTSVS